VFHHHDRAELERTLRQALGEGAAGVEAMIRPCAGLRPTQSPSGRSQLGGAPLVPPGFVWPMTPEWSPAPPKGLLDRLLSRRTPYPPHPMAFVAQIDLAQAPPPVRDHLHLPAEGLLAFFHDVESPWLNGPERRRHSRLYCFTGPLTQAAFPDDLPARDRLPPTLLDLDAGWMTPDDPLLSEQGEAVWFEQLTGDPALKAPERFVGGWPIAAQSSVLIEADLDLAGGGRWPDEDSPERRHAEAHWRQLLQLRGGDPSLGRLNSEAELYVLIDDDDLAAARWADAWVAVQYY
jgi:hypothetical protein